MAKYDYQCLAEEEVCEWFDDALMAEADRHCYENEKDFLEAYTFDGIANMLYELFCENYYYCSRFQKEEMLEQEYTDILHNFDYYIGVCANYSDGEIYSDIKERYIGVWEINSIEEYEDDASVIRGLYEITASLKIMDFLEDKFHEYDIRI